jgi:hypothetical protein
MAAPWRDISEKGCNLFITPQWEIPDFNSYVESPLLKPSFFVDAPGCFDPAAAATTGAISLKNVYLVVLSLKKYPGLQRSRGIINFN